MLVGHLVCIVDPERLVILMRKEVEMYTYRAVHYLLSHGKLSIFVMHEIVFSLGHVGIIRLNVRGTTYCKHQKDK
jgi:hypothetical protein